MATIASLADGQVGTSKATIYTVPASTAAVVKSLVFFNTNASSQTLNVYVKRSGSVSRQIHREATMAQYASVNPLSETLFLSAGDVIEADTTTASAVDYFIGGATESV